MAPASIKDVASRAGVSVGTVSNTLNRPDRVSPKARERVLKAIGAADSQGPGRLVAHVAQLQGAENAVVEAGLTPDIVRLNTRTTVVR